MLRWRSRPGGGVARSTGEAGQRPWREGAAQGKLLDEGTTAAPEAEPTVSTKLAELAAYWLPEFGAVVFEEIIFADNAGLIRKAQLCPRSGNPFRKP